ALPRSSTTCGDIARLTSTSFCAVAFSSVACAAVTNVDSCRPFTSRHEISVQHESLQLPHIARVVSFVQHRHCGVAKPRGAIRPRRLRTPLKRPLREQRNLPSPLAEWRIP